MNGIDRTTEKASLYDHLDLMSTGELLEAINNEDKTIND